MIACGCLDPHPSPARVVLTGGPGAGKTAVLEIIRHAFCRHVKVLPESAGIVFGGGFPRGPSPRERKAAQRAIFHVQHELEDLVDVEGHAVVLCDRGTVDGLAYWPGPEDFFEPLGTSHARELARYEAVIHLETPTEGNGYNHVNPLRIESPAEAAEIDKRIALAWAPHPRRFVVEARRDFVAKAAAALALLRAQIPACCRGSDAAS